MRIRVGKVHAHGHKQSQLMSISLPSPFSAQSYVAFSRDQVRTRVPGAFGAFGAQVARNSYECHLTNGM